MSVTIQITADTAKEIREELIALVGFVNSNVQPAKPVAYSYTDISSDLSEPISEASEPADAEIEPPAPKKRGRPAKEKPPVEPPKPLIQSDPENRVEPDPQDEADDEIQDMPAEGTTLTHDDVRDALQKYVAKFGMPAAQEDAPKVLARAFDASVTKVSAIPGDQDSLAKAVAGVTEMLTKNPFLREAV